MLRVRADQGEVPRPGGDYAGDGFVRVAHCGDFVRDRGGHGEFLRGNGDAFRVDVDGGEMRLNAD